MKKNHTIIDSDIQYVIKRYVRSKSVKILIHANREVVVTAPYRVSNSFIQKFIYSKRIWINNELSKFPLRSLEPISTSQYRNYKKQARELISKKIEILNSTYNFKYNAIAIRNQKSRWGSCSNKGNLNFNYKIIFLTEDLADYLIVHELCHLKEMNHGPNFWKLVSVRIPNYIELRKKLHEHKL